jgi:REP element-mobilizing transposase RayT
MPAPHNQSTQIMVVLTRFKYRRRLPHLQEADVPIFVTFRKGTREPLAERCRSAVLERCLFGNGRKFRLHAAVVMPEHVHLLLTPMRDADGEVCWLADILKGIKGASAHDVNCILGTCGPVWQEESFDHVIRSEGEFEAKVEYIEQNPVRRGLVRSPEEYRWLWVEEGM